MNAPVASIPQSATENGSLEPFVLIRLRVPDGFPFNLVFPPNNYLGSMLLGGLILSTIRNSSVAATLDGCCGPLNRATIILTVSDQAAALTAAKNLLDELTLLSWAELFYFDQSEGILRSFLTRGQAKFVSEIQADLAAQQNDLTQVKTTLDMIKSILPNGNHFEQ